MSLASMPDAQYSVKSNGCRCARARQWRRLKASLVDIGLDALARGDMSMVERITLLVQEGGMAHA